jgi:hypothetical protein
MHTYYLGGSEPLILDKYCHDLYRPAPPEHGHTTAGENSARTVIIIVADIYIMTHSSEYNPIYRSHLHCVLSLGSQSSLFEPCCFHLFRNLSLEVLHQCFHLRLSLLHRLVLVTRVQKDMRKGSQQAIHVGR